MRSLVIPSWLIQDCVSRFVSTVEASGRYHRALDQNRTCWVGVWEASVMPPRPRTGIVMRFLPVLPA